MTGKCTRSLSELVQSLPQEIYDLIYEATFTVAPGALVVSETSRVSLISSLMHVDRRSRLIYAEQYYGNTFIATSTDIVGDLLETVAPQHQDFLNMIYAIMPEPGQSTDPWLRYVKKRRIRMHWGLCYGLEIFDKIKIIEKIEVAAIWAPI